MKLEGKTFLVTGGAAGLGAGACRALYAKGANVVIADRDDEAGAELAKELGERALYVNVDVTEEESIAACVQKAAEKWGNIWGVVNCAGTGYASPAVSKKGKPHDISPFEFLVKLNLTGTFSMGTKCAAVMTKNVPEDEERGVVINVASVAAFDGQNGQCAYSATKGGVVGMTLPWARDLGRFGIRVNTIAPGVFQTALTAHMETPEMKKVGDSLKGQQVFPNTRFGRPTEFGHLVVFIAENSFLNGETIRLDAAVRMPKL